jgi:xylulokinase
MHVLALEVGVGFVRAAVVDVPPGQARRRIGCVPVGGVAHTEYTLDAPEPCAAEVPASRLWDAVAAAGRAAVRLAGVAGTEQDVSAVGLTCFMPGLVLLGADDEPLGPIWTPRDRRARPAARQVNAHLGTEFLASIGSRPLPGGVSVLMFRQQLTADPYLCHRVRTYLHVGGWLALKLTGAKAFDPANASATGLFGTLTDQAWSPRWCKYFEVDREWLPPVVCGTTTVGTVRAAAASEVGVPAGVPVKLGASELSSVALASRLTPGELLRLDGATQVLACITDQPAADGRRRVLRLGFGAAFLNVAQNPLGAAALEWVRRLCFSEQDEAEFYDRTISSVRDRKPRVRLDPPFLDGDALGIEACRGALRDLELRSDRLDVLAAVLAALTERQREAVAALGMSTPPRRIVLLAENARRSEKLLFDATSSMVEHAEDTAALRGIARLFEAGR